jgi:hypothetical protein
MRETTKAPDIASGAFVQFGSGSIVTRGAGHASRVMQ